MAYNYTIATRRNQENPAAPQVTLIEGLEPGATYSAQLWALQSDMQHPEEFVESFNIGEQKTGRCYPTGGDTDCDFYKCKTVSLVAPESGRIEASYATRETQHDCDCVLASTSCSAVGGCTLAEKLRENVCYGENTSPAAVDDADIKFVGAGYKARAVRCTVQLSLHTWFVFIIRSPPARRLPQLKASQVERILFVYRVLYDQTVKGASHHRQCPTDLKCVPGTL